MRFFVFVAILEIAEGTLTLYFRRGRRLDDPRICTQPSVGEGLAPPAERFATNINVGTGVPDGPQICTLRTCGKGFSAFAGRIFVLTHGVALPLRPQGVSSPLVNRTLKGERATLSLRQILSPLRIPHSYGRAESVSLCRAGLNRFCIDHPLS